ncbi:hypothetical protein [Solicola gregarius]|uniref:Transcriptional regulator, AbiEi antitoxin, Type IV TA system n=1 Tax=Solicola gregarius TaxID=2908642 RepID=A0AA46THE7_9ACTN|nr:hypothetical protein [Solicola gregarius]UYM05211.1 hypothetical protein L0C25_22290 [Solicola gregarius]
MTLLLDPPHPTVLEQLGVLTTAQAESLYSRSTVRRNIAGSRWSRPVRGVVVVHNGPLTPDQRDWVALLSCPRGSALAGQTALRWDGFDGFDEPQPHVVLREGNRRPLNTDVVPHFSTMLEERDVHPLLRPRRTRVARSLVDFAAWQDNRRRARAIVLSGVQQRLTNTHNLRDALSRRGPCRHRALIVQSILDAAGGIQSLPERDFDLIRIDRGLPPPTRQAVARRNDGKYYLDVEWLEYDTACEIHGIPHLRVPQWDADLLRANEITIVGPRLIMFSSYAVRHEQTIVGDQLERMLGRGGWSR